MKQTFKTLITDADLFVAALSQTKVNVFRIREGKPAALVDYSGPLQKWTPEYVKLGDIYYKRNRFEFRVHIDKTEDN